MAGRALRSVVWLLALAFPALPAIANADESPRGVRVSLYEGLPKGWAWTTPKTAPNDQFEAPALGFARLPRKYNSRGIEVDRVGPFALQATATLQVPAGPHRLILRSRNAARLLVDGQRLAETKPVSPNSSGHEDVPEVPPPADRRWRYVATGDQEQIVAWTSDGKPHQVDIWVIIGDRKLRHETGELTVSVVAPGGVPTLIGSDGAVELTDASWTHYVTTESVRLETFDTTRRRLAARSEESYWRMRHEAARRAASKDESKPTKGNVVDAQMADALRSLGQSLGEPADDAAFYRRLTLDTTGTIPEPAEVEAFLADRSPHKRERAVDQRLADPRWADAWLGYWQDVLAENPGILKPTLNNTGPFRNYLQSALVDNTAADRFVTELIRMEGSPLGGGPAGFGVASQNDVPMAAKAQILAKAFLAAEMKCARCHDAPSHPFDQSDLFGLAALLDGKPVTIPTTSTVKSQPGGRVPAVSVTLKAGEAVEPHWNLADIGTDATPADLLPPKASSRDRLALMITGPANTRFAPVLVNRLWKRLMGVGLVEPVDDWDNSPKALHPALLAALARELMTHDYDLKHVARLILTSRTYQSQIRPGGTGSEADRMTVAAIPARRRMTAEEVLDAMFTARASPSARRSWNLDPDGRRPPTEFLNLGTPRRAWQFTSLSNERDRPALSLPVAQSLVDVLETFGWRSSRQDPLTERDEATTPLQPAMLANGVAANRAARLSDDSAITALCLIEQPADALIQQTYVRILSRRPTDAETQRAVAYLGDSYKTRVVAGAKADPLANFTPARRVSWSNHLSPEATRIQLEMEKAARAGDPPTNRLTPAFRERMEDLVWALLNSPEFVFVP
ncbi:MAG: DUF1553 domain-containing protein [Isosphaeraceae bacterium]